MPFDAVFLTALAAELRAGAVGSRVDRVHQPARDQIILQLRGRSGTLRLLLCANPGRPRVHFTAAPAENPAQPPMFCMLLRKHLTGGKLTAIDQPPMERLLDLTFQCTDELGEPAERHLIAEVMGRNSNLILCGGDGRIVDCLRRVDLEMSEQRQVLPGLFYHLPPARPLRNPAETGEADLLALLPEAAGAPLARWLQSTFAGLSPLICRELAFGFAGDVDAPAPGEPAALAAYLAAEFARLRGGPFTPVLLLQDGAPRDFTYRPIAQYGGLWQQETLPDFSALLDRFYSARERTELVRQKGQALRKTVTNLRDRTARKLAAQEQELAATRDRERLRQLGDIVTANLHAIARGQPRLTAVDFYDEAMPEIDIPLQPQLSPQQNAARFYKAYAKAKHAEQVLTGLIEQGRQELAYLGSILDELDRAEGERDLQEIRAELTDGGYLRRSGGRKQPRTAPSRPMAFRSDEGYDIRVGRNNRQNDQLTLKTADRRDLWLHVKDLPGSHVIVACAGLPAPGDETVTQAAMLAAWFSQARDGQNVAVDVTAVRNVRKPAGARPGMVIYEHYTTVYVTPDAALAQRLRAEGKEG